MARRERMRTRKNGGLLKTSSSVAIYFQGKKIILENHYNRESFLSDASALQVLGVFSNWKTPSEGAAQLSNLTRKSVLETVARLKSFGILIEKGSEQDIFNGKFRKAWLWPAAARNYHFSTKIKEYSTREADRRYFERNLKGRKAPPLYKTYPRGRKIRLFSGSGPDASFFATLKKRKTVREFTRESISFRQFSRIVHTTWGRSSYYDTMAFGKLLHKTSPSAGSRHPIEVYVIINNVDGLDQGLYHYSVEHDALELLKPGDLREKCVEYCAGQDWVRDSSAVFFMTAVVARTLWKYRDPRAYRALLLDTGHLSQTFLLTSNALGLGAFCIGIIADLLIEQDLGLDGVNETALFAVGVGRPARKRSPEVVRDGAKA